MSCIGAQKHKSARTYRTRTVPICKWLEYYCEITIRDEVETFSVVEFQNGMLRKNG